MSAADFDHLAKDALQIVMQFCDSSSHLALARCNRAMLIASRAEVAWRGGIAWVTSCHDLAERIAGSVLRYSDIALRWKEGLKVCSHQQPQSVVTDDELASILRTPRLKAVDARSRYRISESNWSLVLQHEAFRNLTALSIESTVHQFSAECVGLLGTYLKALTSLNLSLSVHDHPATYLEPLTKLPVLRSLNFSSGNANTDVQYIGSCLALRDLGLTCRYEVNFNRLLADVRLQRNLESLMLSGFFADLADAEWQACWTAYSRLTSLSLHHCGIEPFLDQLASNPLILFRLTLLHIGSEPVPGSSTTPSRNALERLLRSRSAIEIAVYQHPIEALYNFANIDAESTGTSARQIKVSWTRMNSEFAALQLLFPHRMQVRHRAMQIR